MALEPETDAWAQIRYAYEHTDQPIGDICIAHGISSGTLRDRMRRWQWKRRRPPISHEGPPAAMPRAMIFPARRVSEEGAPSAPIEQPPHAAASWPEIMTPSPTLPLAGGGSEGALPVSDNGKATPYFAPGHGAAEMYAAPAVDDDADPAAIVPRLRSASARVLPAIEATLARLAAGTQHPREMERASRALSALTRTLRELNALLSAHAADAARDNELPEDMDAFRDKIAQRIQSFIDARRQAEEEAKAEET
jgi:hypothetical protein